MQNTLLKIEELKTQLAKLKPMKPQDEERLQRKFMLDWNYNSNHIEGSTLTYKQTELLLIFDQAVGDTSGREILEMTAHNVAIQMVEELAAEKERPLTETFIKKLNETMLVRPFWKDAETQDGQPTRRLIDIGEYKKHPNSVKLTTGKMFHYASPEETPAMMGDLMAWYKNSVTAKLNAAQLAAELHYKFVRIHPFDDGNGRIARLLMNYVLLQNGFPPVIIKSENKKEYLAALNRADAGDLNFFNEYIANELKWSLEISIKAAKGEPIEEPGDLEKKLQSLKKRLEGSKDEEVKEEKNEVIAIRIFNEELQPLFREILLRLEQFEPMFKSRTVDMTIDSQGYANAKKMLENADAVFHIQNGIGSVRLDYRLNGFRKAGVKTFDVATWLTVTLYPFVYEFKVPEKGAVLSKLYHQKLNEDEKQMLSEALGNYLIDNIEKTLEAKMK